MITKKATFFLAIQFPIVNDNLSCNKLHKHPLTAQEISKCASARLNYKGARHTQEEDTEDSVLTFALCMTRINLHHTLEKISWLAYTLFVKCGAIGKIGGWKISSRKSKKLIAKQKVEITVNTSSSQSCCNLLKSFLIGLSRKCLCPRTFNTCSHKGLSTH